MYTNAVKSLMATPIPDPSKQPSQSVSHKLIKNIPGKIYPANKYCGFMISTSGADVAFYLTSYIHDKDETDHVQIRKKFGCNVNFDALVHNITMREKKCKLFATAIWFSRKAENAKGVPDTEDVLKNYKAMLAKSNPTISEILNHKPASLDKHVLTNTATNFEKYSGRTGFVEQCNQTDGFIRCFLGTDVVMVYFLTSVVNKSVTNTGNITDVLTYNSSVYLDVIQVLAAGRKPMFIASVIWKSKKPTEHNSDAEVLNLYKDALYASNKAHVSKSDEKSDKSDENKKPENQSFSSSDAKSISEPKIKPFSFSDVKSFYGYSGTIIPLNAQGGFIKTCIAGEYMDIQFIREVVYIDNAPITDAWTDIKCNMIQFDAANVDSSGFDIIATLVWSGCRPTLETERPLSKIIHLYKESLNNLIVNFPTTGKNNELKDDKNNSETKSYDEGINNVPKETDNMLFPAEKQAYSSAVSKLLPLPRLAAPLIEGTDQKKKCSTDLCNGSPNIVPNKESSTEKVEKKLPVAEKQVCPSDILNPVLSHSVTLPLEQPGIQIPMNGHGGSGGATSTKDIELPTTKCKKDMSSAMSRDDEMLTTIIIPEIRIETNSKNPVTLTLSVASTIDKDQLSNVDYKFEGGGGTSRVRVDNRLIDDHSKFEQSKVHMQNIAARQHTDTSSDDVDELDIKVGKNEPLLRGNRKNANDGCCILL